MKKFIAILLAVALFTALAAPAMAVDEEFTYKFVVTENGEKVTDVKNGDVLDIAVVITRNGFEGDYAVRGIDFYACFSNGLAYNNDAKTFSDSVKSQFTPYYESTDTAQNVYAVYYDIEGSISKNSTGIQMSKEQTILTFSATVSDASDVKVWCEGSNIYLTDNYVSGYDTASGTIGGVEYTYAAQSGETGSGGTSASTGDLTVDGKDPAKGTTETKVNEDTGIKETTVKADFDYLDKNIGAAGSGEAVSIVIEKTEGAPVAKAELAVKNIEDMKQKDMSLVVKAGDVSYTVPATAIDTDRLLKELGASSSKDVPVQVVISECDEATQKSVKKTVENAGAQVIVSPVEFEVTASYGGKTVRVDSFDGFVKRDILVSSAQAQLITTAVVSEADGSLRPVPTCVFEQEGKWFARISSRTNSVYALISSEQSFADAEGKWYQNAVNEMASRKVVNGRDDGYFDGGAYITRAEFAAIVVRALGLPANGEADFTDVSADAWYYGAVGAAAEYGLITGYDDGSFKPLANITRQEAMQIVKNAASLADYAGATGALDAFSDAAGVASWAKAAAQFNVGSGLIVGSDGKLNASASITRAETATVVLRLLQKAEMVDVRAAA